MSIEQILAVRLALLEERVVEMKRLAQISGYEGNFYSLEQDLTPEEAERVVGVLDQVLKALEQIKGETGLSHPPEKTSRLLVGLANVAFVSCLEMEPQRMKGYGCSTPRYKELWSRYLEPVKEMLKELADVAEKARK